MTTQTVLTERQANRSSTVDADPRRGTPFAIVAMDGRVNRASTAGLTSAYEAAVAADPDVVVLDFSQADYLTSSCLALVVDLLGRARAEGRRVFAAGLTDHYQHLFTITRLADYIECHPDVDAATRAASLSAPTS